MYTHTRARVSLASAGRRRRLRQPEDNGQRYCLVHLRVSHPSPPTRTRPTLHTSHHPTRGHSSSSVRDAFRTSVSVQALSITVPCCPPPPPRNACTIFPFLAAITHLLLSRPRSRSSRGRARGGRTGANRRNNESREREAKVFSFCRFFLFLFSCWFSGYLPLFFLFRFLHCG